MQRGKEGFSVLRYLIYFSQVGFTVITPPVLCCFGAIWLLSLIHIYYFGNSFGSGIFSLVADG